MTDAITRPTNQSSSNTFLGALTPSTSQSRSRPLRALEFHTEPLPKPPTPYQPKGTIWQTPEDQSEALESHGKALRPAPQSPPTQRPGLPKSTSSLSPSTSREILATQSFSVLLEQKINEAVTFFNMHGDRPLMAKGVISNAKLFDYFAAQGIDSTNVMLLLTAITHTKASVFQFVDDGTHRCITPPDYSAQLTSIIVVSFSKIAESDPVIHWITVHANLTEKFIRIYDSMDVQARQLISEEELPTAYLQPIKLILESFPFVTALGVDRRTHLIVDHHQSLPGRLNIEVNGDLIKIASTARLSYRLPRREQGFH